MDADVFQISLQWNFKYTARKLKLHCSVFFSLFYKMVISLIISVLSKSA